MTIVIDNYDSFTWNIVQALRMLGEHEITVVRNDTRTVAELEALQPARLVLSSGPGKPAQAGILCDVIRTFAPRVPLLGIGLGHLALGEVCGATILRAAVPLHGKTADITGDGEQLFRGIENPFKGMCYHSLLLDPASLPQTLVVTARAADGTIMAIRHRDYPAAGLQFHPESIMTPIGKRLFRNFLRQEVR